MRFWRVEFVLRASPSAFAPSEPTLLSHRLRTQSRSNCQRLLTVGIDACGGVLDVGEGRVDLEHVGDVLCTLCTELVVVETASESQIGLSAAADSRKSGVGRHT